MKPPARNRNKPNRTIPTEVPSRVSSRWKKAEERTLLDALLKLGRTAAAEADIDYEFLEKCLPKRSIDEIRSVVDALKDKAISNAAFKLAKRKRDERAARKPVEEWADLASTLAGSLEGTIDAAFSQVLIVSSTEPCTLRNCDPPRGVRSSTSFGPPARIVPLKPASRLPTTVFSKSPALSTGPSTTLPAPSPITHVPKNLVRPAQERPGTPLPSASPSTSDPPAPGEASPSSGTSPPPSADNPSTSTSDLGQPSSFAQAARKASNPPRVLEVNQIVDFERIYKFLSVVQKPEEECHLTSMESAIVLDLLMSLPEELLLLDCKGLHNHMMKVYQCLTAQADSITATQLLSELKDGGVTQRDEASSGAAAEEVQPPAGSSSSQSQDAKTWKTVPPLNPFMVPLSLLLRKAENTDRQSYLGPV